jgi:hypothetical protein
MWQKTGFGLKSEERDFIIRDNETPDEMYQRILALATTLTGFGCKDNGDDCQTYVHYVHQAKRTHPVRDHPVKTGLWMYDLK